MIGSVVQAHYERVTVTDRQISTELLHHALHRYDMLTREKEKNVDAISGNSCNVAYLLISGAGSSSSSS